MRWKAAILILVLLPLLGLAALKCTSTPSDVIPDLAYVECAAGTYYSDDGDLDVDGISVDIRFYDTKHEQIGFRDVPCKVSFKLCAYPLEEGEEFPARDAEAQLVYEGEFIKDYSYGMGWAVMEEEYEIPLNDVAPGRWYLPFVFVEATVETPKQGVFTCESD